MMLRFALLIVGVGVTIVKAARNGTLPYRTPPGGGC